MRFFFIIGLCWVLFGHSIAVRAETNNETSFLVLSDIHLNPNNYTNMEFAPKTRKITNDLDVATYEHLMDKIQTSIQSGEIKEPEFVIVLGDIAGHIHLSKQNVMNSERLVFKKLKEAFPNTPIFYNFGNNDSFSGDYGVFLTRISSSQLKSPLHIIKEFWQNGSFLSTGTACKYHQTFPCIITSRTASGYYAAYLKPKLRLIALNSVMFSKHASAGYTSAMMNEQLDWLENQFHDAQKLNETVLITTHIPPGKNMYKPYFWYNTAFWSSVPEQRFYKLIMKYHTMIIGILAGHTHKDELKLFQFDNAVPLSGVFINPALSTSHGNAPALRSYVLRQTDENEHWDLSDYQTYYFTREANGNINIQSLYRFQEVYCNQSPTKRINDCLDQVTIEKIEEHISAGNQNFKEELSVPDNIHIRSK